MWNGMAAKINAKKTLICQMSSDDNTRLDSAWLNLNLLRHFYTFLKIMTIHFNSLNIYYRPCFVSL